MRDWVERHLSTEIQEILISETDLWRVNEQSLDCQSALIHTIDEWIRVTYKADTLRELDGNNFGM